ncbi:MAG: HEAT repeat domain-containing protein [Desulfovibrionaceae bacterium]|jgi:hypothetical protein|nr:HEAT repeat domain-containing protein [Desulfovibrionaceae bacterium]
MSRFRTLKPRLLERLRSDDWRSVLDDQCGAAECEAVGPLFSFLPHPGAVRWRAALALGAAVARMADASMESARVVVRRLIWNLNEESGNVAWGAPEAMGAILAAHPRLADEYHTILISYVQDLGKSSNFLDHAPLRRGAYWGIGRLAETRPELAAKGAADLIKAVRGEEDVPSRGLAARALGVLARSGALDAAAAAAARDALAAALAPDAPGAGVELFRHGVLEDVTVADLAREALAALG